MCMNCYAKLTVEEIFAKLDTMDKALQEKEHLNSVLTRLNFICKDCDKDTLIDDKDYYMITPELWEKHGVGKDMLCMDCMEKRLGHKLTKEEIVLCPINTNFNYYTEKILDGKI